MNFGKPENKQNQQGQHAPGQQISNFTPDQVFSEEGELNEEQLGKISGGV